MPKKPNRVIKKHPLPLKKSRKKRPPDVGRVKESPTPKKETLTEAPLKPKPEPLPIVLPFGPKKPAIEGEKREALQKAAPPPQEQEQEPTESPSENKPPDLEKPVQQPGVQKLATPSPPPTFPIKNTATDPDWGKRVSAYRELIAGIIDANKIYPKLAKRFKREGEVGLLFSLNRSGELTGLKIIKRSRFRVLNRAAEAALKRAGSFPPPPEAMKKNSSGDFEFELLMKFKLKNNLTKESIW